MKEPVPVKRDAGPAGGAGTQPRKETREARRLPAPSPDEASPVIVRYYARMRSQRVYSLALEVSRSGRGPGTGAANLPIIVRPLIPGALVVPAELRLDASVPGSRAEFHVTPVARRQLHGARVEVRQQGRPAQEIPLRMKATTQFLTWMLLALAILLPWGIAELANNPLKGHVYDLSQGTEELAAAPKPRPGQPDEVLRDRFRTWARANLPAIPRVSTLIANDAYGQNFQEDRQRKDGAKEGEKKVVYNDLASWISWGYRWVLTLYEDGLALYVGVVLFVLALVSWFLHRAVRTYQRHVLQLAPAAPDAGAETLPLGSGEESHMG